MAYDFNRVMMIGRSGSEVQLKTSRAGTPFGHFSLATQRGAPPQALQEQDGESSEAVVPERITQWNKVVLWGRLAERCAKHLKKGETVFVEGTLRLNSYVDKEGLNRMVSEVHADSVRFLGFPAMSRAQRKMEDHAFGGQSSDREESFVDFTEGQTPNVLAS